jgi:hypothetical protein
MKGTKEGYAGSISQRFGRTVSATRSGKYEGMKKPSFSAVDISFSGSFATWLLSFDKPPFFGTSFQIECSLVYD